MNVWWTRWRSWWRVRGLVRAQRRAGTYIRNRYNIPARVGGSVRFDGRVGIIVRFESAATGSAEDRIVAKFGTQTMRLYPTWMVEYLPSVDRP